MYPHDITTITPECPLYRPLWALLAQPWRIGHIPPPYRRLRMHSVFDQRPTRIHEIARNYSMLRHILNVGLGCHIEAVAVRRLATVGNGDAVATAPVLTRPDLLVLSRPPATKSAAGAILTETYRSDARRGTFDGVCLVR